MDFLTQLFMRLSIVVPASWQAAIGQDKVLHFMGGLFFGVIAAVAAVMLGGNGWWCVALAAAAGLIKEGLDWFKNRQAAKAGLPAPHTVDFWDAIWTALGGVAIALLFAFFAGLPTGVPMVDPYVVSPA